jgi:exopolysaccharide biosynthesis polyprenyl glycosylphosphotransferase
MGKPAIAAGTNRAATDPAPEARAIAPELEIRAPVAALDAPAPVALPDDPVVGADRRTVERDSILRRSLAFADMFALVAAYGVLWLVAPPPNTPQHDAVLLFALPLWVVLNKSIGLYDRDANLLHKSTLNELPELFRSISLGTALAFMFGPLLPGVTIHRPQLVVWWIAAMVVTPLFRYGARMLVSRSVPPERVLIVGSGSVNAMVSRKIAAHPEYGAQLVGYIDAPFEHTNGEVAPLRRLGGVEDFEAVCRANDVERVVIAFSSLDHTHLLDLIRAGRRLGLKVSVVPRLFEIMGQGVEIDQIEGMTLLGLRSLSRTGSTLLLKRMMDVSLSTIGLLLLWPVLAAVALAIKLDSHGPVLFCQRRVGRGNREFRMWKFRTMIVGADQMKTALWHLNEVDDGTMFKIANDPRITRVGRFLRRASLDELPQLWNVLRGEMSLVGPRPLIPSEDDQVIGWHRSRLDLTPGLTGPWQVMGRNAIPFQEMVKLDYLYVTEWSLWNDLKLLLRTLPVVVGRRGH